MADSTRTAKFVIDVLADVFYVLVISYFMFLAASKIIRLEKKLGMKRAFNEYWTDVWNLVDWISISGTFVSIGTYGWVCQQMTLLRTTKLGAVLEARKELDSAPDRTEGYEGALDGALEQCEAIAWWWSFLRFAAAFTALGALLRFLKTFRVNRRLAVVTATLRAAWPDLAHFFSIFFLIFLFFALVAHILFGAEHGDFDEIPDSLNTCFLILMGDFDLWRMMAVNETFAVAWFFVFEMFAFMLLLNMLLAIVMDVYMGVKGQSASSQTLWEQSAEWFASLYTRDEYDVQAESREIVAILTKQNRVKDLGDAKSRFDPLVTSEALAKAVCRVRGSTDIWVILEDAHRGFVARQKAEEYCDVGRLPVDADPKLGKLWDQLQLDHGSPRDLEGTKALIVWEREYLCVLRLEEGGRPVLWNKQFLQYDIGAELIRRVADSDSAELELEEQQGMDVGVTDAVRLIGRVDQTASAFQQKQREQVKDFNAAAKRIVAEDAGKEGSAAQQLLAAEESAYKIEAKLCELLRRLDAKERDVTNPNDFRILQEMQAQRVLRRDEDRDF